MKLSLAAPSSQLLNASIKITGSKSESNRLLLLQAIYPELRIENLSNSDDSRVMQSGLALTHGKVDIHHAGTAMRFLTSYFASQPQKEVVLTGSKRMTERPIKILVDALRQLGADITYVAQDGYPPLKIKGVTIVKNKVSLPANISSQYISSLCLIAPSLANGLEITLVGKITSVPYIEMTLTLLEEIGISTSFNGQTITIAPQPSVGHKILTVESDWSAASYYFSVVALSEVGSKIRLSSYKKNSLQGDSVLVSIYQKLGVETLFEGQNITLVKSFSPPVNELKLDLSNAPDIAQTIAVSCFGLGLSCHLKGLHTLPIKETDRLAAMKTELEKFGAKVKIDSESLTLEKGQNFKEGITVDTYQDHRMAMAFAPLALKTPFCVNEAEVVAKSYPDFWEDFKILGFKIDEV